MNVLQHSQLMPCTNFEQHRRTKDLCEQEDAELLQPFQRRPSDSPRTPPPSDAHLSQHILQQQLPHPQPPPLFPSHIHSTNPTQHHTSLPPEIDRTHRSTNASPPPLPWGGGGFFFSSLPPPTRTHTCTRATPFALCPLPFTLPHPCQQPLLRPIRLGPVPCKADSTSLPKGVWASPFGFAAFEVANPPSFRTPSAVSREPHISRRVDE